MDVQKDEKSMKPVRKNRQRIFWRNTIFLLYCHLAALYTLVAVRPMWYTVIFNAVVLFYTNLSTTAGPHRLWAHRTYSARWPLKLFLLLGHTAGLQFSVYKWVFYHRVHHKYTDTTADPHDSRRGLFYCQVGWFLFRLHEDTVDKWRTIDMRDVEAEFIVRWQHKLFFLLGPLCCLGIPTLVPHYYWGESLWTAWHCSVLRFITMTHITGLVNSLAHAWGMKPYDKNISARDAGVIALLTQGEGWHNYHHAFPWDYRARELGGYALNTTTAFLDLCGRLGLASDFKVASPEMIKSRMLRTGDGSGHRREVWGWGDADMVEEDKKLIKVIKPRRTLG